MLCFGLYGNNSVDVLSCEETIIYNANKENGIPLCGTIAFKINETFNKNETKEVLRIIHPRRLDDFRIASPNEWNGSEIPFSHLYNNICEDRLYSKGNDLTLKLYESKKREMCDCDLPVQIIDSSSNAVIGKSTLDGFVNKECRNNQPYSCIELSFLESLDSDRIYLLRVHGTVPQPSFNDLVLEDMLNMERTYRIYGPRFVYSQIKSFHIPRSKELLPEKTYSYLHTYFNEYFNEQSELLPQQYSVITLNNPLGNPCSLTYNNHSKHILHNISDMISPNLYSKPPLVGLEGSVLWFVSTKLDDIFYLELNGPIEHKKEYSHA